MRTQRFIRTSFNDSDDGQKHISVSFHFIQGPWVPDVYLTRIYLFTGRSRTA
jgi:hypothetical protein